MGPPTGIGSLGVIYSTLDPQIMFGGVFGSSYKEQHDNAKTGYSNSRAQELPWECI